MSLQAALERMFPLIPLPPFVCPDDIYRRTSAALLPPARVSVREAGEKYIHLRRPDYNGPMLMDGADYMEEPANMVRDRRVRAVVYAGPAQSRKTAWLIDAPIAHAITCNPVDMLVIQMTEATARRWSLSRLQGMVQNSPEIKARLSGLKRENNIFDKVFSGMTLSVGYPTGSQLSSASYPVVLMTDYDRYPEDINGEGPAFNLAAARIRSFGSLGTVVAESSPKAAYSKKWTPAGHAAPPVPHGILPLYNQGDRRRQYWQCPDCAEGFEPKFDLMHWPRSDEAGRALDWREQADAIASGADVTMVCPHCGSVIEEAQKRDLNRRTLWVPEGEVFDAALIGVGYPPKKDIVSYWAFGPAAVDQGWRHLAGRWCELHAEAERTGDDSALAGFVNLDIGDCYLPEVTEDDSVLDPVAIRARASSAWSLGTVPDFVRALVITVDVQGSWFDVQVTGYGPHWESAVIAWSQIAQVGDRKVDPGRYLEDWDLLRPLLDRVYPLAADPARGMRPLTMVVDSGGAPGVTGNAYAWVTKCRNDFGIGEDRLMLLKGDVRVGGRRVALERVDYMRSGKLLPGGRGRRLLKVGSDALKDDVFAAASRGEPGPGYLHTPHDLPAAWYTQLAAESRQDNGTWQQVAARNEAIDHLVYSRAALLRPPYRWDSVNWERPVSGWAQPQPVNSTVVPLVAGDPAAGEAAPVPAAPAVVPQAAPSPPPEAPPRPGLVRRPRAAKSNYLSRIGR